MTMSADTIRVVEWFRRYPGSTVNEARSALPDVPKDELRRVQHMIHERRRRARPDHIRPPDKTDLCVCGNTKRAVSRTCADCHNHRERTPRPMAERFWAMVAIRGADECWLWLGSRAPKGYGRFNVGRSVVRLADRVAWELVNGPIPDGLFVLHRCDNPPCVQPTHLFLGTAADNTADMMAKGRHATQRKSA